jgi:RsiW-degrading membrane proteinase PrsW (M82 family)
MNTERDVRLFLLPVAILPLWIWAADQQGPVHLPEGSREPLVYAAITVLGYLLLCRWWFPMDKERPGPGIWWPFMAGLVIVPSAIDLLHRFGPGVLRVCLSAETVDYLFTRGASPEFAQTLFRQVVMVGMVEEWGKRFAAHKTPESTLSGQVGSGFAAGIGFGVAEAVDYSFLKYNGHCDVTTYVVRFVSLVGLHGTWSAMSTFIRCHLSWKPNPLRVLASLFPVALLHATYNSLMTHAMPDAAASLALVATFAFVLVYCVRRRMQELEGELEESPSGWWPKWDRR